ncbi:PP2C family protein-serine/threonine phosphatase [Sulfurimonas sp.]|uniref:ATP-binding SpoIIE family protein phosphatase n=1 Tax=Sulfurimonas sp. TaxID=2022749 RepID=UPI00261A2584|nr:PP2C family protein-serine/threonine phosphatase [Sulfurimonas sp.]
MRTDYDTYQEELAFQKELNILRNDFYYQLLDDKDIALVDFMYKPLDTLSGDAYTARRVDENRTFYLIVDGMGKGLSASLTSMIMTTFVNHIIDKMIEHESFSLDILLEESIAFIKPILLEEEALSIDYILFDTHFKTLEYAKFSMPVFLLEDKLGNIVRIASNNPPLSKWQQEYKTAFIDVSDIHKFLFYSDGIVENSLVEGGTYADKVEEDFKNSFTREEIKEKILSKIAKQEDDLTLIFINTLCLDSANLLTQRSFNSTLEDVDRASQWYSEIWQSVNAKKDLISTASVVFSELFMNAYEHGNLGLSSHEKHLLLENDNYFERLQELQKSCDKTIKVKVYKLDASDANYIVTQIFDEGKGFDTQILSEIFRNSQKFNGRGVFISRSNSMGIYYNRAGNCVLFLHKL